MFRIIMILTCLCFGMTTPLVVDPLSAATAQPDPKTGEASPLAVFPDQRYTFEPVMEGDKIRHDFVVENQGDAPLIINNIRPD